LSTGLTQYWRKKTLIRGSLELAQKQIPGIQTGFLTIDPKWLSRSAAKLPLADAYQHPKQALWYGGFNPGKYDDSLATAVAATGGTYWSHYFKDTSESDVSEAHFLGIKVSTPGADSHEDIRYALATGIDSITTGYVDRANALLSESVE
jgi:glycerophosphoryl diester phosphodiesterase